MSFQPVDLQKVNALELIKNKWLKIGFVSQEEGDLIESALIDVFLTHSQSYQLPTLISKLFVAIRNTIAENSGGVHFNRSYIPSSLLKTFTPCVLALPNQQALKLWGLFITELKSYVDIPDIGVSVQAGACIIAQLFSSLLIHINISDMVASPGNRILLQDLIKQTESLLSIDSAVFDPNNDYNATFQMSLLLLIVSYRRLRSSCHLLSEVIFETPACCGFDFLPSHQHLGCDIPNICQSYLDCDDKRISYFMIELLKQEMITRALRLKDKQSIDEEDSLKVMMAAITNHAISVISNGLSNCWDLNINSLSNENYGTAVILSYMLHLPRFVTFVNSRQLVSFCSAVIDALMHDPLNRSAEMGVNMHESLYAFLKSSFFTESKALQTAFVTAIWIQAKLLISDCGRADDSEGAEDEVHMVLREVSSSKPKWAKYGETTPKTCQDGNSMWLIARGAADRINRILSDISVLRNHRLNVPKMWKLIKILNYLPLEFLLPGNQIRCLFGLSLSLFLLEDWSDRKGNTATAAIVKLVEDIFKTLIPIFEGVRSIWLFDLVEPTSYIKAVISMMTKIKFFNSSQNMELGRSFLGFLFSLATRTEASLLAIEVYFPELAANMEMNICSALAFQCLLLRISKMLEWTYLTPQMKETCIRLAVKSCSSVAGCIKGHRKELPDLEILSLYVGSNRILLKLITNPSTSRNFAKKDKLLKWLPHIIDVALEGIMNAQNAEEVEAPLEFISEILTCLKDLSDFVPENMGIKFWTAFKYLMSVKHNEMDSALSSVLNKVVFTNTKFLKSFHDVCCISPKFNVELTQKDLSANIEQLYKGLSDSEKRVISGLVRFSSDIEAEVIFKELGSEIVDSLPNIEALNVSEYRIHLCLMSSFFNSVKEGGKLELVSSMLQKCLAKVVHLMNQLCVSPKCLLGVAVPSLNFIAAILEPKNAAVKLSKQSFLQCIQCCINVNLEAYVEDPVLFIQAFQPVVHILSLMLSNRRYMTLSCLLGYFPIVTNLLKSVVKVGSQQTLSRCDDDTVHRIQQCVNDLVKLFTAFTKHETELSKMVPYLIADYVHVVQNITLHPSIKILLVSGINRLLGMCSEDSISMLSINVSHTCREICQSLVRNYKSSRFSGQV